MLPIKNLIINAAGTLLNDIKTINYDTSNSFFLEDIYGTTIINKDNNFIIKGDRLQQSQFIDKIFDSIIENLRPNRYLKAVMTSKEIGLQKVFKDYLFIRSTPTWVYEKLGDTIYQSLTTAPLPIINNTITLSDFIVYKVFNSYSDSPKFAKYYIGNASALTQDNTSCFLDHLFLYKIVLQELAKNVNLFKSHYKVILYVDGNKVTVFKIHQGELNNLYIQDYYKYFGSTMLDYENYDSYKPERNANKILYAINTNLQKLSSGINAKLENKIFAPKVLIFRYNLTPDDPMKLTKQIYDENNLQFLPYVLLRNNVFNLQRIEGLKITVSI